MLILFISPNWVWGVSPVFCLEYSIHRIMLYVTRDNFISYSSIWKSFLCLIALDRTSGVMFSKGSKSGYFYLVFDLGGRPSSFSTVWYYYGCFNKFPLHTEEVLFLGCWMFLSWRNIVFCRCFFFIFEIIWGFFLSSIKLWITLIDFSYVEPIFHSWDKYHFTMTYNSFNIVLYSFC